MRHLLVVIFRHALFSVCACQRPPSTFLVYGGFALLPSRHSSQQWR